MALPHAAAFEGRMPRGQAAEGRVGVSGRPNDGACHSCDPAALLVAGSGVYAASYGAASTLSAADVFDDGVEDPPAPPSHALGDFGGVSGEYDVDAGLDGAGLVDFSIDGVVPGSLAVTPQLSSTTAALLPRQSAPQQAAVDAPHDRRRRQDALHSGPTPIIGGALYLGSAKDANDAAACRAAGITAYLCAAGTITDPLPLHARQPCAPVLHLPLEDAPAQSLSPHVEHACAFIDEQLGLGGRVLVYCQAGRSRSVSVVAAYLMRRRGINADAALGDVRARYPRADPNIGFLLQLGELGAADDDGGDAKCDRQHTTPSVR